MKEIIVKDKDAGGRLDKYIKKILPSAPGGLIYKQLRKKNITLNGHKADGTEMIQKGDSIRLFFSDETFDAFSKTDVGSTGGDYVTLTLKWQSSAGEPAKKTFRFRSRQ